jgi:hypothetical protein
VRFLCEQACAEIDDVRALRCVLAERVGHQQVGTAGGSSAERR